MNPEVITKILKALLIVGSLFGINISEESSKEIAEGLIALYAVITIVEAKIKSKPTSLPPTT